jgi:ABC-type sugar transport system permease subunit
MSKEKTVEKQNKNFLSGLFRQQIFIPIAALIILAVWQFGSSMLIFLSGLKQN